MIKLFAIDLDGCLAYPFKQPDWAAFEAIRKLNEASLNSDIIPALTICTGRPLPYAECVAQFLGVRYPLIFESGGGMYNIRDNELLFNPLIEDSHLEQIERMKAWFRTELIPNYSGAYPEFTKKTDCGLVHPSYVEIKSMLVEVEKQMKKYDMQHDFELHHTEVSINIILKKCNKAAGLKWLCDKLALDLKEEVAYIGDSSGDIRALEVCSLAFAPENATKDVKTINNINLLGFKTTSAILEAYKMIISNNEKGIRS